MIYSTEQIKYVSGKIEIVFSHWQMVFASSQISNCDIKLLFIINSIKNLKIMSNKNKWCRQYFYEVWNLYK